ncbi:TPA: AMP-binding protein [Escherichia coli]|nr:AMP-binding protein [Escherichia coli]
MNIIVCAFDNIKYALNKNGKNPSLISYNGIVHIKKLMDLLIKERSDEDIIYILLSEKNFSVSLYCQKYKDIIVIYENNFKEKIAELKSDRCLFIHSDELFSKSDMINFLSLCKKKLYRNIVAKKNLINKHEALFSLFCFTKKFILSIEDDTIESLCYPEYIDNNLIFNRCNTYYLNDSVFELYDEGSILALCKYIDFPKNKNIPKIFRESAKKYADKVALTYLDKTITYKELDYITDIVASELLDRKKISGKNNVGILLNRSIEYIVCMIAVLKTGMSYVPMSKLYPVGRLNLINKIADLNCIITDSGAKYYESYHEECVLYEDLIHRKEINAEIYSLNILPESIAYIMFTSGSTGEPKGVKISHRNVINNAFFLDRKVFGNKKIKPYKYGVIAEFVFDMSVQQIYPSLLFGKNLNIYSDNYNKSPLRLLEFLNKVDTSDATPIILQMITEYIESKNDLSLNNVHLVVGGEKLQYNLCKRYFDIKKESEITNIYGPTECTVEISTFYLNKEIIDKIDEVPIGTAVDNSRVYILDDSRQFLLPNVVGEIYVSGECVGHGYINSKELSEKFYVNDILSDSKMYKTGDFGYWNENGELCFVGRRDRQIKIRGFRIDLCDIESTIEKYAPVLETRVFTINTGETGEKIVAYFIGKNKTITLSQMVYSVEPYLPQYMIPSFFIPVDMFSINMNGKLDKSKLPDLSYALKDTSESKINYSKNDTVAQKIAAYASAHFFDLSIDVNDYSFLEMGFDSLNLLELLTFISEEFKVELTISNISMQMKLSELVHLVKDNLRKVASQNYDNEFSVQKKYKKSYKCIPMQNYILDLEYSDLMLYGKSGNIYTMTYIWNLNDDIDCERLKSAVLSVVNNNDAFFMRFQYNKNRSKVFFVNESNIVIEEHIVKNINKDTVIGLLQEFDFRKTPLAFFAILRCNGKCYLLTTIHHLIFDYISAIAMMKSIENYYYNGKCSHTSFFDVLEFFNRYKDNLSYNVSRSFLKDYCSKTSIINFNKYSEVCLSNFTNQDKCTFNLSSELEKKVKDVSKKYALSEFLIYLTSFFKTLYSITHQEVMTIATFVNGRSMVSPINTIGFFSRYIPVTYYENGQTIIDAAKLLEDTWHILQSADAAVDMYEILENVKEPCNVLFDYQKMYNTSKKDCLYSKFDTYDFTPIGCELVFRLYDFGDFTELRIEYVNNIKYSFIQEFVNNYVKELENIQIYL